MREISLEDLLTAGCHFGHQVTRSNPKAREFIFEARDNIHIIDLTITKAWLEEAAAFVISVASKPSSTMIVVGAKRQAKGIVEAEVKRSKEEIKDATEKENLMFVTSRWIGGLLTNFTEVNKNLKKLKDIEELLAGDEKGKYTKKELGMFDKERQKLEGLYGGIKNITKVPDALFIIDSKLEELSVRESRRMNVPSVAITDTNSDPGLVDFPIPANDDAVGSIELIVKYIVDCWIEGKNSQKGKAESVATTASTSSVASANAAEAKTKEKKETPAAAASFAGVATKAEKAKAGKQKKTKNAKEK